MPYWTVHEEKKLIELLPKAACLEDLAVSLGRSAEAVAMKLKRMGLSIPPRSESSLVKIARKKDSLKTTTTTPKLEPLKFEQLPSPNEALGLQWAALQRLREPDVGREEAKKLRLIIQGVKAYIHLDANYVLRIIEVERRMLVQNRAIAEQLRSMIASSTSPEEKARLEQNLREVEKEIKEAEELGIGKPRRRNRRFVRGSVDSACRRVLVHDGDTCGGMG
ncbi:hypothetical protein G4O51_13135, partial [Candidatus Bathyarchaeota archaeon A05DMB-2]|nr:hypothetical protein [Candidatus Bathyarchaeota archaeon A05DMB-2]